MKTIVVLLTIITLAQLTHPLVFFFFFFKEINKRYFFVMFISVVLIYIYSGIYLKLDKYSDSEIDSSKLIFGSYLFYRLYILIVKCKIHFLFCFILLTFQ